LWEIKKGEIQMASSVAQHVQAVVAAMTLQVITGYQQARYGESIQLTMGDRDFSSPVYGLCDDQDQRISDMDEQEYQSWACMSHPATMNLIPHMGNFGAAEDIGSPAQQAYRHRKTITNNPDFINRSTSPHDQSNLYEQGDDVYHSKWGAGVVIRCDVLIATVRFGGFEDGYTKKVHGDWLHDSAESMLVSDLTNKAAA